MVKTLSVKLGHHMEKMGVIQTQDLEIYHYAFEGLISWFFQIALLTVIAITTGMVINMIAYVVMSATLKRWLGGLHARSQFECISIYTILAVISCYLSKFVSTRAIIIIIPIFITFSITAVHSGPRPHPNRPKTPSQLKHCNKIANQVVIVQSVVLASIFFLPESTYQYLFCGGLGMISSVISMVLSPKGAHHYENT